MQKFTNALFLAFLFMPFFLSAQKETIYWFRGAPNEPHWRYKYGEGTFDATQVFVNFPDAVNHSKNPNIAPQMATIADKKGNLLLYTDGYQYWDNTHTLFIPPLAGMTDLANKTYERMLMIVPHPKEPDWYYCIKSDLDNDPILGEVGAVYYDLIDLKNKQIKERDQLVANRVARSFAIMKAKEEGFWLVVLAKEELHSYRFDKNGFQNVPVRSAAHHNFLRTYKNETNYLQIKTSPDSKHLAINLCHIGEQAFRLTFFKFNTRTGSFGAGSYHYILDNILKRIRAIEFGADSRTFFAMEDSVSREGRLEKTVLYEYKAIQQAINQNVINWQEYSDYQFFPILGIDRQKEARLLIRHIAAPENRTAFNAMKKDNQLQLLPDGNLFFYEHRYSLPLVGGIRGIVRLNCGRQDVEPQISGVPIFFTQSVQKVSFPAYFFERIYQLPIQDYENAAGSDQNLCQVENVKLGKTDSKNTLNYRWVKNQNLLDNPNSPTPTFLAELLRESPKEGEVFEFILEVSDKLSCAKGLDTVRVKFTNSQTPIILSDADTSLCKGQKAKYWLKNRVPEMPLRWFLDDKLVLQNKDTLSLEFFSVGKGQIKAESFAPNCSTNFTTGIFKVNVQANPVAEIEGSAQRSFCEKGILQAKIIENAQYQWFRNNTLLPFESSAITVSQGGSYYVIVGLGKCLTVSKPVEVQIVSKPEVQILKNTPEIVFCREGVLQAKKQEGIEYQWFMNKKLLGEKAELLAQEEGWYFLTARQQTCVVYDSVKVSLNRLPPAKILAENPIACEKTLLKAPEGQNLTYQWFKNRAKLAAQGQTLEVRESGYYQVVISRQQCSDTSAFANITIFDFPTARILDKNGKNQIQICQKGTIRAEKIEGAKYLWSWGANKTDTAQALTVTTSGNYFLQVSRNNCVSFDTVEVVIFEKITAQIEQGKTVDFCDSGLLKAVFEPRMRYNWLKNGKNIGNSQTLQVSESGVYTLFVERDICTDSTQISVQVYPKPQALLRAEKEIFCEGEPIRLWVEKPQNAHYQWFKDGKPLSMNSPEIRVQEAGKYWTNIRTNGICETQTNAVELRYETKPEIRIGSQPKPTQPQLKLYPNPAPAFVRIELPAELKGTDKQLVIQNSSAVEILEWRWEGKILEAKGKVLENPVFGKYQVRVRTEKGCEIESQVFDFQEIKEEKPQTIRIELWDVVGRKVWSENLSREKITPFVEVRTTDLPQAVYWLKILTDSYQSVHKLVIE